MNPLSTNIDSATDQLHFFHFKNIFNLNVIPTERIQIRMLTMFLVDFQQMKMQITRATKHTHCIMGNFTLFFLTADLFSKLDENADT